jgi:hypothetical protein
MIENRKNRKQNKMNSGEKEIIVVFFKITLSSQNCH